MWSRSCESSTVRRGVRWALRLGDVGVLVANAAPELVKELVLVAPSARYLDDDGYVGGFTDRDIDDLLELMASHHLGWQDPLAGLVAGAAPPEVKQALEDSFCRTRPDIAARSPASPSAATIGPTWRTFGCQR